MNTWERGAGSGTFRCEPNLRSALEGTAPCYPLPEVQ